MKRYYGDNAAKLKNLRWVAFKVWVREDLPPTLHFFSFILIVYFIACAVRGTFLYSTPIVNQAVAVLLVFWIMYRCVWRPMFKNSRDYDD